MRIRVVIPNELHSRLVAQVAEEGCTFSWAVSANLEAFYRQRDLAAERMQRHRTQRNVTQRSPDSSSKAVIFSTKSFIINQELLETWKLAYPALDVEREIRKAHAWILANPKNRKSNWHRFLVNWLSKAQDRAPRVQVEPERIRPAVLVEPNGPVAPMPAEIREQMRKIIEGVKMP